MAPGLVITDSNRHMMSPEACAAVLGITRSPRLGEPRDIAAMVAFLMSDDGEWINGQVLSVDGGVTLRRNGSGENRLHVDRHGALARPAERFAPLEAFRVRHETPLLLTPSPFDAPVETLLAQEIE